MGYTKIKDVLRLEPQATAPLSPSEGDIYNDAVDGILVYKQGDWQALGGGGGSADFDNLVTIDGDGLPTLSDNTDFETSAGAWYVYADAAAVTPVDMASGSPVSTRARTTSSPLSGEASLLFDLGTGSSRQGEGLALEIAVPVGVRGGPVNFSMLVSVTGAVSNDDLRFFAYDVTNAELVYPTYGTQIVGSGLVQCVFPTKTTTAALRVGIHVARTATTALSLKIDDVKATRRQGNVLGLAGSDTQAVTMTYTALGTIASQSVSSWGAGDRQYFEGKVVAGVVTGSNIEIILPTGMALDTSAGKLGSTQKKVGSITRLQVASTNMASASSGPWDLFYDGSTNDRLFLAASTSGVVYVKATGTGSLNDSDALEFKFDVPIAGRSSNVTMASDPAAIPTAFSAGMAANYVVAANQPILWDTVVADTVGAYNIATGIYTVRVAGNYKISATIRPTATAASYVQINATARAYLSESGPSILTSGSAEYPLAVGDQVSIRLSAGTTVTGNPVQFFGTFTMARITGSTSIALDNVQMLGSAYAELSSVGSGSTALPIDDTIPQITEGNEVLTVAYTPKRANSYLKITYQTHLSEATNVLNTVVAAFFRSDSTDAIHVTYARTVQALDFITDANLAGSVRVLSGTTSPVTFSIRAGGESTVYWNSEGSRSTRLFGTTPKTTILIEEFDR